MAVVIWLVIVPFLTGCLFFRKNMLLALAGGSVILFALFQLLVIPAIYLKAPLHYMTRIWLILTGGASVISLILNGKIIFSAIRTCKIQYMWVVLLIAITLQAAVYIRYEHIDEDDSYFVAAAAGAVETDTIYQINPYTGLKLKKGVSARYALSPFPMYYAMVAKLSGIHPTVLAHGMLPAILVYLGYAVYALISRQLFQNKESVIRFMIALCFINTFGGYSEYSTSEFFLSRLWQGKAVLASVILPFALYVSLTAYSGKMDWKKMLLLAGTSVAGALMSSMGIFFMPVLLGCCGLAGMIKKKSIKEFLCYIVCCIPSICYGVLYLLIK